MTAAAQQDVPRQVEVLYSNVGPAEAWRVGDECYIAPSVLTSWHWPFTIKDADATIQAEGRTLKVPTKIVHERVLVPVRAIVEQLGATCRWHGSDELDVLGEVRMIAIKGGALQVDSTISSKPHVFPLTDPSRLVVDLRGMILGARVSSQLPANVNASQLSADTVRIVYQADDVPKTLKNADDVTRHFVYNVDFSGHYRLREGTSENGGTDNEGVQPPNTTTPQTPPATSPATGQIGAKSPVLFGETSRSLTVAIPLSAPLTGTAPLRWRRVDLYTFELTLPGVHFTEPILKLDTESIEEVSLKEVVGASILRLQTSKPMGLELSTHDSTVELTFHKPLGSGGLGGKTIVIDPGHGGQDTGARSPDHEINEKDLTLAISADLGEDLASEGATVIMTRNSDVFIPLKDRSAVANDNGADLFISIHINSNAIRESRSGTTTYYHGHDPTGQTLAECVEHEIAKVSGLPKLGVSSDTSRYRTGFAVLRYSKMPAILVETGYLNCTLDRTKMCDENFQIIVAKAIVKGVKVFLSNAKEEDSR